jgi:tetratricopeptide (TPR) repeat protein
MLHCGRGDAMSFSKANDLKKAEKLVQQGKIAAAIKEYGMLVAANPNDITLVNTLGDLCVREGRIDEAIVNFLKIGESYSRNGFTLKAIAMYKKIYKLAPSNLDIALKLAELYAKQGLAVDARKQYMEVADAYNRSGRPQQALDIFRKVADLDPENIPVRLKLAESYQREGVVGEALEAYVAAGTQLVRKGNLAEAQPVFLKVLELNPVNKLALNSLASIHIKQGEPQKAVSLLTQTSQANPDDIDLIILMGRTFLSANLLHEAEQAFLTLLEADKSRFEYLLQLAHKFVDAGQYDRAVSLVETCLEIMISRRQETRGVEILESVAELDPHHIHTWECLAIIYSRLNEERELIRVLNGLTAAAAYHNNMPVAKRALYELLELDPEDPTYRQRLRSLGIPEPVTATLAERDRVAPTSPLSPGVGQRVDFEFAAETPQPAVSDGFPDYAAGPGFAIPANGFAPPAYESPAGGFSAETGFSPDGGFSPSAFGGFSGPGFGDFAPAAPFPSPFQTIPPAPAPTASTSELQKSLTDADRFASLGLADKAVEILEEAAVQSPGAIEVRLKLKELYADGGLLEKAADQSLLIADLYERAGDQAEAQRFRNEAYSFNPELRRHATQPFVIQAPLTPPSDAVEIDLNGSSVGSASGFETRSSPAVEYDGPEKVFGFGYDTRPGFTPVTPPEPAAPLPDGFYAGPPHPVDATSGPEPVFDMSAHVQSEFAGRGFADESVIDLNAETAKSLAPSETKLGEELEGVDFFLSQGYNDIARETLVRLSVDFPNHPEILARLNRLDALNHRAAEPPPVAPPASDRAFDMSDLMSMSAPAAESSPPAEDANSSDLVISGLISELEEALEELEMKGGLYENGLNGDAPSNDARALSSPDAANDDARLHCRSFPAVAPPDPPMTVEPSRPEEEVGGLQDVFDEFKQSLEAEDEEVPDFETHYNLGLAYKDMELYEDAVEEFQSSFRATDINADDGRYFQVCNMLGLCFMAKGSPQLAAVWFKRGVEAPGRTEDEYQAMRYDLGLAYEGQGKYDLALEMFETVYAVDINYREVGEKLEELRAKL